jgi:ribosomal protein S18 acetylase RimI-like enzyme
VDALRPMSAPEYTAWLFDVVPAYAEEKVASGQWSQAEALERSAREFGELLPAGLTTLDNHLFTIVDADQAPVGALWFAVQTRVAGRVAYVFDVSVVPERQRQGHAWRAFQALEDRVRALGLAGIALHVFGHNAGARALYAKLGYEPTNINLYKPVAGSNP